MAIQDDQNHHSRLDRAFTFAQFYILNFRHLIEVTKHRTFPSEAPLSLLEFLYRYSLELESRLEKRFHQYKSTSERDEIDNDEIFHEIWLIGFVCTQLASYIRYSDFASIENIPWGLVSQFQRFCNNFDEQFQVIVRSRWGYNHDANPIKKHLRDIALNDLDFDYMIDQEDDIIILSFPRSEVNNILHHAVWAHEIGHVLEFGLGKQLLSNEPGIRWEGTALDDPPSISLLIADEILNNIRNDLKVRIGKNAVDALEKTGPLVKIWVREIVCDLLAIRLFGPAALFAFVEFSEGYIHNITQPREYHPPPIFRIRLMNDLLAKSNLLKIKETDGFHEFQSLLESELSRIQAMVNEYEPKILTHLGEFVHSKLEEVVYQIALQGIANHSDTIIDYMLRIRGEYFLRSGGLSKKLPQLIEHLRNGIPPNKIEIPNGGEDISTLPAILNAGWIYWLIILQETAPIEFPQTSRQLLEERRKLNLLVLKALESSEIQHIFLERKEHFGIRTEN